MASRVYITASHQAVKIWNYVLFILNFELWTARCLAELDVDPNMEPADFISTVDAYFFSSMEDHFVNMGWILLFSGIKKYLRASKLDCNLLLGKRDILYSGNSLYRVWLQKDWMMNYYLM